MMSRLWIACHAFTLFLGLMAPSSEAFVARATVFSKTKSVSLDDGRCQYSQTLWTAGKQSRFLEHLCHSSASNSLLMATAGDGGEENKSNKLPFILDPGTKGGAVFLSLVLFVVPLVLYNISLSMGLDMIDANRIFGVGFTVVLSLAWVSTYIFRVATKDMTYVRFCNKY
jgi:hypothetical protein